MYIIQFLRLQVLRAYLEIQDLYANYLTEDKLSAIELNDKFFRHSIPGDFLKSAPIKKLPTPPLAANQLPVNFQVQATDFRKGKENLKLPSYAQVIKNPERFSRFEEALFTQGLIREDYSFKREHGQIQELAAAFHVLIRKGYFNSRLFPGNKPIKPVQIRKFLDNRYQSDTDKQFRDWANSSDKLAEFIDKKHWLDKLPVC